jgi:small conductance mechanosensitive channel
LAALINFLLRRAIDFGFALSTDLRDRFPGLEARTNRFLPYLRRILQAAVWIFVLLALLQVWGIPSFEWLASDVGRNLAGRAIGIGFIIGLAIVASELVNYFTERYLRRKDRQGSRSGYGARVRTLLPLLRNAFRVVLGVMVVLIVLSELGIDIAPLLAGAGVVGLAIGFGAQTLVKDVITGFFILVEDVVSIGDVVDLDGRSGVVEAMTIRSIRLRDSTGAVHTVPFSAVTTVKNLTKDYAYAVFNVRAAVDEEIDRIVSVLKEIGAELQRDPSLSHDIRAGLEVLGVDRLEDEALVVQARIMTAPGSQWSVSREFNHRLKAAFDERGIQRPTQTMRVVGAPGYATEAG